MNGATQRTRRMRQIKEREKGHKNRQGQKQTTLKIDRISKIFSEDTTTFIIPSITTVEMCVGQVAILKESPPPLYCTWVS